VPGLKSSAKRSVPNWLLTCWADTASTVAWMSPTDIDGSKT
jgi:hypothetical protein